MTEVSDWRMSAQLPLFKRMIDTGALERLHGAIEKEITAAIRRIDRAAKSGNPDYQDVVADEESNFIEELLGLAFVAMQTYLTTVRTSLDRLSRAYRDLGHPLTFPSDRRIFDMGEPLRSGSPLTAIRAIYEVANYWKHQDEWDIGEELCGRRWKPIWKPGKNSERRTIEVIRSLEMTPGSTGNLRSAAEALDATDYKDLSALRSKLRRWTDMLYQRVYSEINGRANDVQGAMIAKVTGLL
jgi:hypothetical protein